MARFRYHLAAQIVAEAEFSSDKLVCERYGIIERTLRNYRTRAAEDRDFAALCRIKREQLASESHVESARTLKAQQRFMRRAARLADPKDPRVIRAIAGAQKINQDGIAGKRILDTRIRILIGDGNGGEVGRPVESLPAPECFIDETGDDTATDTD